MQSLLCWAVRLVKRWLRLLGRFESVEAVSKPHAVTPADYGKTMDEIPKRQRQPSGSWQSVTGRAWATVGRLGRQTAGHK